MSTDTRSVSNAFRLLGSGEPIDAAALAKLVAASLKCLSAFGFWGTRLPDHRHRQRRLGVSNAFRLLGSGEQSANRGGADPPVVGLKCLSAFGFWGTAQCHRAFHLGGYIVSNAFRLLGSGGLSPAPIGKVSRLICLKCLSAFGFWGTNPRYY